MGDADLCKAFAIGQAQHIAGIYRNGNTQLQELGLGGNALRLAPGVGQGQGQAAVASLQAF